MRIVAPLALAACWLAAAFAQQQFQSAQGRYDFICKDGKPVGLRIITIVPGEFVAPLPKEPWCPKQEMVQPQPRRAPGAQRKASAPAI